MLDSLRGLDETIQYGQGEKRKEQMSERSKELVSVQENLSRMEGSQRSVTNMVILLASFGMLALAIYLYTKGGIGFEGVLTCTIAMMGSFGPVVALSSLSNNLNQTLASVCFPFSRKRRWWKKFREMRHPAVTTHWQEPRRRM